MNKGEELISSPIKQLKLNLITQMLIPILETYWKILEKYKIKEKNVAKEPIKYIHHQHRQHHHQNEQVNNSFLGRRDAAVPQPCSWETVFQACRAAAVPQCSFARDPARPCTSVMRAGGAKGGCGGRNPPLDTPQIRVFDVQS